MNEIHPMIVTSSGTAQPERFIQGQICNCGIDDGTNSVFQNGSNNVHLGRGIRVN